MQILDSRDHQGGPPRPIFLKLRRVFVKSQHFTATSLPDPYLTVISEHQISTLQYYFLVYEIFYTVEFAAADSGRPPEKCLGPLTH